MYKNWKKLLSPSHRILQYLYNLHRSFTKCRLSNSKQIKKYNRNPIWGYCAITSRNRNIYRVKVMIAFLLFLNGYSFPTSESSIFQPFFALIELRHSFFFREQPNREDCLSPMSCPAEMIGPTNRTLSFALWIPFHYQIENLKILGVRKALWKLNWHYCGRECLGAILILFSIIENVYWGLSWGRCSI